MTEQQETLLQSLLKMKIVDEVKSRLPYKTPDYVIHKIGEQAYLGLHKSEILEETFNQIIEIAIEDHQVKGELNG